MFSKPSKDEYLPMLKQYIDLVADGGDIIEHLKDRCDLSIQLLSKLTEEQANYKYAEGKWSIKTVIGHVSDVERLWQYRLLRIARGDSRELPVSDRDIFAINACNDNLKIAEVLEEFTAVRYSTLSLLRNLPVAALTRTGIYNEHALSVRAIPYIVAGHEEHHMTVIQSKYIL